MTKTLTYWGYLKVVKKMKCCEDDSGVNFSHFLLADFISSKGLSLINNSKSKLPSLLYFH